MRQIFLLVMGLFLATLFVRTSPALAASITVNTTAQKPGSAGDCTLGEAIEAANTDTAVDACIAGSGTDTITLPAGTYTLSVADHTDERHGSVGLPTISSPMTISGAGAESTIVERTSGAPDFRIFFISAHGGQVTLNDFTIRGGTPSYYLSGPTLGGAISNVSGKLVLESMLITANSYGAIHGGLGEVHVNNSRVNDNFGDGIVMYAEPEPSGSLIVLNSQVNGNLRGIASDRTGAWVTDSTVSNNLNNGIFSYLSSYWIAGSTLSNNGGNGIFARRNSRITINDSTIFGNHLRGLSAGEAHWSGVVFTNTTISQNAGGVLLDVKGGLAKFINSTITENTAGNGAGILLRRGRIEIVNSILAGNHGKRNPNCFGNIISFGHNIFGALGKCVVNLRSSDRVIDPQLGAWSDDSTPGNGHYPLLPTSPAIDKGRIRKCPATDQLGNPRVGRCDIGAIEYIPAP